MKYVALTTSDLKTTYTCAACGFAGAVHIIGFGDGEGQVIVRRAPARDAAITAARSAAVADADLRLRVIRCPACGRRGRGAMLRWRARELAAIAIGLGGMAIFWLASSSTMARVIGAAMPLVLWLQVRLTTPGRDVGVTFVDADGKAVPHGAVPRARAARR